MASQSLTKTIDSGSKVYVIMRDCVDYQAIVAYVTSEDEAKAAVAHLGSENHYYEEVKKAEGLYHSTRVTKNGKKVTVDKVNTVISEQITEVNHVVVAIAKTEEACLELMKEGRNYA